MANASSWIFKFWSFGILANTSLWILKFWRTLERTICYNFRIWNFECVFGNFEIWYFDERFVVKLGILKSKKINFGIWKSLNYKIRKSGIWEFRTFWRTLRFMFWNFEMLSNDCEFWIVEIWANASFEILIYFFLEFWRTLRCEFWNFRIWNYGERFVVNVGICNSKNLANASLFFLDFWRIFRCKFWNFKI